MEYASEQEKVLEDEGGWVDTHHYADKDVENKISEMKLEDASSSSPGKIKTGVLNLKINAQSRSVFPKLFKLADHTILQNILADQKIFQNQFCGPLVRNFVQKLPVLCSNISKI